MAKRKRAEEYQVLGATADMAGATANSEPDRDRIARRAYELYLQRGGGDGRADEDWFSAEREVGGERSHRES
jgi:hypothetical protein